MEIYPESGKTEIFRHVIGFQAALAVIEHRRIVSQFLRLAILQFVDLHRALEEQAEMEKLGLEPQFLVAP